MNKTKLLFPIIFLLTISIYSQEYQYKQQNFSKEIIPLTFSNGCPIIEVKIDGKPFHLLIDTGAEDATVKLTPSTLKKILITTQAGEEKTYDYQGNTYHNMKFLISSLKLGNLEFRNLNATEELRSSIKEDGIIGNQLLKHFNIMFDYKAEKMILYTLNRYPEEIKNDNWTKINIGHNNIGLILSCRAELSDKELKFCLDTGVGSIENGKTYGILKPSSFNKVKGNDAAINIQKFFVDGNNIGPFDFKFIDYNIPSVDGFLGNNIFAKYKVFIDFNNNLLYLNKY